MNGIFAGSQIPGFRDFCGMKMSGFWDLYGINPRFFIPKNHKITGFSIPQKSRGLIPSLRLKFVEILVHFSKRFSRFFAIFLAKKKPGACVNAHAQHKFSSRALQKHRVRKNNFFHIFARTVLKTSFSALNWVVAVRTRG